MFSEMNPSSAPVQFSIFMFFISIKIHAHNVIANYNETQHTNAKSPATIKCKCAHQHTLCNMHISKCGPVFNEHTM